MHEEDFGILWKHTDSAAGRRPRCAARGGWWSRRSHGRELRVRLLLVPVPGRQHPVRDQADRHRLARRVAARRAAAVRHAGRPAARTPPTTSTSSTCGSTFDLDGARRTRSRGAHGSARAGREQPARERVLTRSRTPLATESEAQRLIDPLSARYWKIVNPAEQNARRRAGRLQAPAGRQRPCRSPPPRRVVAQAGRLREQARLGDAVRAPTSGTRPATTRTSTRAATACREWTQADRPIEDTDVVLWYTFGHTTSPRPED